MVSTLCGSKPGWTLRSSQRLRIMSPAPMSSTKQSATSQTTRRRRVRAANTQSESAHAEQNERRGPHIANQLVTQRHDDGAAACSMFGIRLFRARREGAQLGLRLWHVRAFLQPSDDAVVVIGANG